MASKQFIQSQKGMKTEEETETKKNPFIKDTFSSLKVTILSFPIAMKCVQFARSVSCGLKGQDPRFQSPASRLFSFHTVTINVSHP